MRTFRLSLVFVLLVLVVSGCEMTVRVDTKLRADGGGDFTIGMQLDREMRDQLEGNKHAGTGMASLQQLFDRLEGRGWTVRTTQPDGGLAYEATRRFRDSADFDRALGELSSAQSGRAEELPGVQLEIDHDVSRSLMRTTSSFSGRIDTTGGSAIPEETRQLVQALGEVVRFEIRAELPGAIVSQEGDATITDGAVIWRPRLGTSTTFAASASALNTGSLLMVLVPLLGLLAAGGWFLAGRGRASRVPSGGAPTAEEAQHSFRAIQLDPPAEEPRRTVTLDEPEETKVVG